VRLKNHFMSFTITLTPSNKTFTVNADEPILSAALRQGIGMPYGCKNGACGSCKGRVQSGQILQGAHQAKALSEDEAALGLALFCCAQAQSDVTIECREVVGAGEMAIKKMPVRIASLQQAAPDVMVMKLQLPATEKFQYFAGQYVEFILRDGKRRSYSMATAPSRAEKNVVLNTVINTAQNTAQNTEQNTPPPAEQIELHIRHLPGGTFTDMVFGAAEQSEPPKPKLKERDILRIEGPFGTFFLREESTKPMVFLASGTCFAPIKALMEQLEFKNNQRAVTLYWGGRRPQDLYQHSLCEEWAQRLPWFKYVPVISNATPEDYWHGRTGFVHRAVMHDFADLSQHQVYACGAPIVVDSARAEFVAHCHLPADEFFADSFTSEADLAKAVSV
jgi:CDP-4-dehydro-6-deoxyglucose reductase